MSTNIGIYKITNKQNGKFYIGSSKQIDRRWWEHKNDLIKNKHHNIKLQHAWNYYGSDAFDFIIIEEVTADKLLEREDFYLNTFRPYIRDIGYNINDVASGGDWFTNHPDKEKYRLIYSQMSSGKNNAMYGKSHSEESINLQKTQAIGRYTLEWFKKKCGDIDGEIKYKERNEKLKNRKMNYSYDNGLTGTTREPMSQDNKNKISSNKARLKLLKPQIFDDIRSELYTISFLADKYKTSTTMIKYYKKQIKKGIV
jgi:group I intron endonuclease